MGLRRIVAYSVAVLCRAYRCDVSAYVKEFWAQVYDWRSAGVDDFAQLLSGITLALCVDELRFIIARSLEEGSVIVGRVTQTTGLGDDGTDITLSSSCGSAAAARSQARQSCR